MNWEEIEQDYYNDVILTAEDSKELWNAITINGEYSLNTSKSRWSRNHGTMSGYYQIGNVMRLVAEWNTCTHCIESCWMHQPETYEGQCTNPWPRQGMKSCPVFTVVTKQCEFHFKTPEALIKWFKNKQSFAILPLLPMLSDIFLDAVKDSGDWKAWGKEYFVRGSDVFGLGAEGQIWFYGKLSTQVDTDADLITNENNVEELLNWIYEGGTFPLTKEQEQWNPDT